MGRARDDRRPIHAYLTEEAHHALYEFARINGPSVSAILQAWCDRLSREMDKAGTAEVEQDLVKAARSIDADRRIRAEGD